MDFKVTTLIIKLLYYCYISILESLNILSSSYLMSIKDVALYYINYLRELTPEKQGKNK